MVYILSWIDVLFIALTTRIHPYQLSSHMQLAAILNLTLKTSGTIFASESSCATILTAVDST